MAKPKLRFPEFADEWKEKKAEELFENITIKGQENKPILAVTQDRGVLLREECGIDIKFDEKSLSNYKLVVPGNFIISLRSFQGGLELSNLEGIVSPAYTILNNIMPVDKDFYKLYFKSYAFIKKLNIAVEGIRDGKQISYTSFKTIKLPTTIITEQQKIADFLSKIDEKIANQEVVVSDYEEMKKGLMQKIFSQEVRFKADDGSDYLAWKTRIMKDCLKYEQPTKYIVSSEKYNDSYETPVLTANKGFVLGYTDDKDGIYDKGNVIIYDDFTMDAKYVNFNFKVKSSAIKILTEREGINLYFIFLYLQNLKLQQAEHARSYISKIEPMSINIPCLEEQQKIADCLFTMDRKIEAEKKILEDWKELKKALLQQMFV